MTDQELAEMFKQLGISPGGWAPLKGGQRQRASLDKQRGMLTKLRDMFQDQLNQDVKSLLESKEMLNRIKFGGGK